jgi:hypothetical protein
VRAHLVFSQKNRILLQVIVYWNPDDISRTFHTNLKQAKEQFEYYQQVVSQEHAIVERMFERGANRVKTYCDGANKYTSPASIFNGDILLEAPSPSGGVFHLLGDFTGHGLAA